MSPRALFRVGFRSCLGLCAAATLATVTLGCPAKPPPPKLPPKELPRLQQLDDTTGQRGSVIDDAVQAGSNQAKITYSCAPPHGRNVDGSGLLSTKVSRCEIDTATKTVTLSNESNDDCPGFVLSLTDYHGKGTYNTSSITQLSFGIAKVRQAACRWDGSICMNWSRADKIHPETQCTVDINSDGGLQYGTMGATLSGTFVCSAFTSAFNGCAGVVASAGCGITRGSFSVTGCTPQSSAAKPPPVAPPVAPTEPARGRGRRR